MPVKRLKEFLDKEAVAYVVISHSAAYTAQGIAKAAHLSGNVLAKVVVVKIDGKMGLAVLPAPFKIDLGHLRKAVGSPSLKIATEEEFKDVFPDCDVGAMPPFGNLYKMDVYVDASLAKEKEIVFNAGSHKELIRLAYKDFKRLVKPKVIKFSFVTL